MTNDDEPNAPIDATECWCGNLIVAEGERVTCDGCGREWWISTTDHRTRENVAWFKALQEMDEQNKRCFKHD